MLNAFVHSHRYLVKSLYKEQQSIKLKKKLSIKMKLGEMLMKHNKTIKPHQNRLKSALLLAVCGAVPMTAQAALPVDAILAFDAGQIGCLVGGTPPNCTYGAQDVVAGSYFAMDANADGTFGAEEKIVIEMSEGVRLGDVQPASGSHSGYPDGSEFPSIDIPWSFFGNTGMHQTTLPVVIINGDDGTGDNTASIDFSGWAVIWNGIANIPMGGDSANFPADTGVAVVNCLAACNAGDTFSLDYFARIPLGDSSGFGGVSYTVHLEGVINPGVMLPPTKNVTIQLTGGNSHECSSPEGGIIEANVNIITTDISDIASVNWTLDGADAGSGNSVNISSPLGEHTIGVVVDTLASGVFDSSQPVTVSDTTAPELDILFIDRHTGEEITEVVGHRKHRITVKYDVVDLCDSEATASGVAVPVHTIENGDSIIIKKKKLSTATLGTSAVNVTADAIDESGNHQQRSATLLIID